MKTGIEALPQATQDAIKDAEASIPPETLKEIQDSVEAGTEHEPELVVEHDKMVRLLVPDGGWDYPISHGEQSFYPHRLQIDQRYPNAAKDFGGPWVVDVPFEIYHHFMGPGGFTVYEG